MMSGSSTKPEPPRWTALPPEIRLLILEAITQQKNSGWASSAAVCKEWQFVIEKQNFRQLRLSAPCLREFERIALRRQHLIRNILLDIKLPCYTCQVCHHSETESLRQHNSTLISNGIWKLFSILSAWGPAEQKGLELELNAHSPSDSDHWFKHYRFTSHRNPGHEDDAISKWDWGARASRLLYDPHHGWWNCRQEKPPPKAAVVRLFTSIKLLFPAELPRVDVVTRLTIRRQLRRRLLPIALQVLLAKLSRLEHMVYEPWRDLNRMRGEEIDHRACPSSSADSMSRANIYIRG